MPDRVPDRTASCNQFSALGRRLLKHGVWAFAGKLVASGSGVLLSVLLTRLLPPASVGAYFLALSVVTAGALVARGGLEKTVLQLVADALGRGDEPQVRRIVQRVFALAALTAGLIALLIAIGGGRWLAAVFFDSEPMATIALLMAPWTALLTFEMLLAETFRGVHDIPRASVFGGALSRSLCVAALTVLLVWHAGAGLELIVVLTLVCTATALAISGAALTRKLRALESGPAERPTTGRILRTTWPVWVSNVTLFVMGHADLWILGAFRPDDEVALYGVAVRLVLLVGMSLTIVNAVLPPLIGELYAKGERERMERVIRMTASVAAVPSVIVLLSFIAAGGPVLNVTFGPFYRDAAVPLALLSIGQLVNVWVGSCGYTLVMTGHQRALMWSALLSGAVSVFGGLALVGEHGATGVAAAVAAGTIVQQFLMLWLARRRCGVWTHASLAMLLEPARRILRPLWEARRGP